MSALVFTDVHKGFEAKVLKGLTAEIPLEGITFVVGRSGQGKSVLCRLAVGLLRPDEGQVQLFGQRIDTLPERALRQVRARAPYLVQGPALLDWLTVAQNVALASLLPREQRRTEAIETLDRVGLADAADDLPATLGPGAKKRVAIARALVLRPEYLLLDEPTTGLDRTAADQVNEVISHLRDQGLGALVVSHDHRSMGQIADRVLEVDQGRSAFLGAPAAFKLRAP